MLTPAHPRRQDPAYQTRLRQRRRDLEDKKQHPENWGLVRPDTSPAPDNAPAEGQGADDTEQG